MPQPSGLDALVAQGPQGSPMSRSGYGDAKRERDDNLQKSSYGDSDGGEPHFGDAKPADQDRLQFGSTPNVAALKLHFGAILRADHILLRNVQRDADELEDELRRIQDLGSQMHA